MVFSNTAEGRILYEKADNCAYVYDYAKSNFFLARPTYDTKKAIWEVGSEGTFEERDRWARKSQLGHQSELNKRRNEGMLAFDFGHTEKLPVSLLATDQRTKYAERQRAFKERTKAILSTSYNSGDDYYDDNDD